MKINLWIRLIEFLVISAGLTYWWLNGGQESYWTLFQRLAFPLLQEAGVRNFSPGLVRERLVSFIPFVSLMLVTPNLPWRRRLWGMLGGLVLIFFSHVALTYWAYMSYGIGLGEAESIAHYFPALILCDAFPFVLWAVIANRFLVNVISRVFQNSSG